MKKTKKWWYAAVMIFSLAATGLALSGQAGANTDLHEASAAYNCPVTGEQLPCPACCPLK